MNSKPKFLVTICARGGSKGLPLKNIRPFVGKPLIAHTIEFAQRWPLVSKVVVSTDSEEIASVARQYGAEVPFLRPAAFATDSVSKLPALTHALRECEKKYGMVFDAVLDLDPTAPVRRPEELELGYETFLRTRPSLCFSVVKARKNPYFNMVERDARGQVRLCKQLEKTPASRQDAPQVWDMNASMYFFQRDFLLSEPKSLWDGTVDIFEMSPESAFDIDLERDLVLTEALMKHYILSK